MTIKTILFALPFIAALTACTTQTPPAPVSLNPELLRVAETKPAGYPKWRIERQGTHCLAVKEDWRKGDYQGHAIWFLDKEESTVDCPKPVAQQ